MRIGAPRTPVVDSMHTNFEKIVWTKDFLFLAARLVAYWPAPIRAVALLAYTVLRGLPARLAVCYSQRRSIFSSATAFPAATLR